MFKIVLNKKLKKGPKIVIIGGGKGLSNILSGLKKYTSNITSIVSTFDDGGSTGKLVEELGMLPPGDIRKSIIALSSSENDMEKLLTYRFKDGKIDNHSLGNLILAALTDIMGGFPPAIQKMSKIFNVKGQILPVSLDKAKLCAELENGEVIVCEKNIRDGVINANSKIRKIFLSDFNGSVTLAPGVWDAIENADAIVIGPGSLYTSVICNLLVEDLAKALISSSAKKIFIANIMNEPGETIGYSLSNHINEVERYVGKPIFDYCIVNNREITEDMIKEFNQGDSTPVLIDKDNIKNKDVDIIEEDFIITTPNNIFHDNSRISKIIIELSKKRLFRNLKYFKFKK